MDELKARVTLAAKEADAAGAAAREALDRVRRCEEEIAGISDEQAKVDVLGAGVDEELMRFEVVLGAKRAKLRGLIKLAEDADAEWNAAKARRVVASQAVSDEEARIRRERAAELRDLVIPNALATARAQVQELFSELRRLSPPNAIGAGIDTVVLDVRIPQFFEKLVHRWVQLNCPGKVVASPQAPALTVHGTTAEEVV